MTLKPFRSKVAILTDEDEHYYSTGAAEAECFVQAGLAVPIADDFTAFVQAVRLTVSIAKLREHMTRRDRPPRRRLRSPPSSTGGGDLGLARLLGRHRALHYADGPRA